MFSCGILGSLSHAARVQTHSVQDPPPETVYSNQPMKVLGGFHGDVCPLALTDLHQNLPGEHFGGP